MRVVSAVMVFLARSLSFLGRMAPAGLVLGMLAFLPARAGDLDIILPVDVTGEAGEIAVEVDGTDLTEFIRFENGAIVISASAALAPGSHVATIYVLTETGYRVFATYAFDVASAGKADLKLSFEADHEAGVTVVNGDAQAHVASTGTLTAESIEQSVLARLNYVIDSRDENQPAGRFADIAEYSIELRQSGPLMDLVGRIGDQTQSFDPALVADLNRRGLSVEGAGPGERLQFNLFALQTGDASGAANILGLAVEDDRMFGGRFAFRPITGSDLRMSLQGYQGEGSPDLAAVAGIGSGEGLALDGSLVAGRLRYALSFAQTRWDGDGAGALPLDRASATLASIAYDLEPANGAALTFGLDYERVDFFYFSLANPGLATGGETVRLSGDYAADRLTLYGTLETTLTNEGGDPLDPVDRINRLALDGSWALIDAGPLGDAVVTFGINSETLRRVETPPAAPGPENWTGHTAYLGLERQGETAGWSLVYTYLREDDDGPANFDLNGNELYASLDLAPSDRLTIAASTLAGAYNSAFSGSYERFDADLGLDYALRPGSWELGLDLGISTSTELGIDDGAYAAVELTRDFDNGAELVMHAGWYDGSYATNAGLEEETVLGLTYRVRSDVLQ